jgi:hypothetical protein
VSICCDNPLKSPADLPASPPQPARPQNSFKTRPCRYFCAIGIAACQNGHTVTYARRDDLARRLVIARGDGIGHQKLLNELSDVDLLIIDDFLTVGIDPEAANDLFAVLANREHRLPTLIASQSGSAYWVEALPDRVAADSIVNQLATNARHLNLGDIDIRGTGQTAIQAPGRYQVTGTAVPSRQTTVTIRPYAPHI